MNRYIIAVQVPDDEFEKRKVVGGAICPMPGILNPASFKSMEFGTKWINLNTELVMQVRRPSCRWIEFCPKPRQFGDD